MRRALIPIAVLVVLGAPAWPTTIDDSYITLGFAHSLATRGLFTCGGGTAYGFSSPSSVALAALIELLGFDPELALKRLAVVAGVALLLLASRAWPRGPQSAVLLLAVATWEPLAYWSFAGLETSGYAFLLAAGWLLVLRDAEAGLGVLALAAFTRPEGPLHFLAGGLVLLVRGRDAAPRIVLYAGLLGAYYGAIFLEFGTILPTATWVKIALSHSVAASLGQHVGDLLSGVGLFAGCVLLFRAPRLPVLLPLVLQLAVACAAAADWMAHARLVLPGLAAMVLGWAGTAAPRAPSLPRMAGAVVAMLGGALLVPATTAGLGLAVRPTPGAPWDAFASSFDTPQLEDLEIFIARAPPHAQILTEDVGMPSQIVDVRVIDLAGLTDQAIARYWATGDGAEALRDRFAQAPPDLVRRMEYNEGPGRPWPPWLPRNAYRDEERFSWPQGTAILYTQGAPPASSWLRATRWGALHLRFPSQGPVAWEAAVALAEDGRMREAAALSDEMSARFPGDRLVAGIAFALFRPRAMNAFEEDFPLRQESRVIRSNEAPALLLALWTEPEDTTVRLRWSCADAWSEVSVPGEVRVRLPPLDCAPRSSIVVEVAGEPQPPELRAALFSAPG